MEVRSSREVVALLSAEGYRVTQKRLDGLIATGRVTAPKLVGPVRAWTPEDVEQVRRALVALDGRPSHRNGKEGGVDGM